MSIKIKILVTGGCGYIGSVLVNKLLDKEAYVVVLIHNGLEII